MSEVIRIFTSGKRRLSTSGRTVIPVSAWSVPEVLPAAVRNVSEEREASRSGDSWGHTLSERTSRTSRKGDSLLVVRPSSPTYVLSGRTLLDSALGCKLMAMRWPFLLAAMSSRAIMVLLRHTELSTESHVSLGLGGREVRVPLKLAGGHLLESLCAICFLVELFLLMHVVHKQLLHLTLSSFDPWVITLCMMRAVASHLLSRAELIGAGFLEPSDIGYMVSCTLWTSLMVLLETAYLCRVDKVLLVLTNSLLCASMLLHVIWQQEHVDWDPDATINIFWLAPMTFQSQFISAMLSVNIYLGKAVLNFVVKGGSFMFLRAHYALDVNGVGEMFNRLDTDGDGKINFTDWESSLSNLGIPQKHLLAGFKQLDVGASGIVHYETFRSFLGDCCEMNPGISQSQHLALFCQDAWSKASDTTSLTHMVEAVTSQWQHVQLQAFSEDFYRRLTEDKDIARIFRGRGGTGQSVMLSAFVGIALQWLGRMDFMRLEGDVLQLGARHAKYGLSLGMLSTFQEHLFGSLKSQLGDSFLGHEWAFLWMHFVTRPFMRGLARASGLSRSALLHRALNDVAPTEQPLGERPCNRNSARGPAPTEPPAGERPCSRSSVLSQVTGVLERELQQENPSRTDHSFAVAHDRAVTALLRDVLRELAKGDAQQACVTVRRAARVHLDYGLTALDLAHFQAAFLRAVRNVHEGAHDCKKHVDAWTWVIQMEVIEVFLMAPFAEIEDLFSTLPVADPAAVLDEEHFLAIMEELSVPEELARAAFGKLSSSSGIHLTFECVKAAVMSDNLISPGRTCSQLMEEWCRANS